MARLAADPHLRERMGHAARERYEKLFNPALVLRLMLENASALEKARIMLLELEDGE